MQGVGNNHPQENDYDHHCDRNSLIDNIIRIYLKHPTSLECLTDWVKLLNTRLEDCEKLPPGKVQLIKLFRRSRDSAEIFFFVKCHKCHKTTKVKSDEKTELRCASCDQELKTTETNFFAILPIEKQIMKTVENNWNSISSFETIGNSEKQSISDAHDGEILKRILNDYKDSDINILSLCLNVDGANKFKSNAFSVWPIQLLQNFLPPYMRFLPENIILNGLYYHKNKDADGNGEELSFREYLRPLVDELNKIKEDPISMEFEGQLYQFKPIVTHCAIDLPAKSKLQETKQFGGYDACTYCEIHGERVLIESQKAKKKSNRKSMVGNGAMTKSTTSKYFVRYVENDDANDKLRDEIEVLEKMLAASKFDGKEPIDGVKGMNSSFIDSLVFWDKC